MDNNSAQFDTVLHSNNGKKKIGSRLFDPTVAGLAFIYLVFCAQKDD